MSHPVVVVLAETTAAECIETMLDRGIGSLIVVSGNKPVGIVTRRDIFYEIMKKSTSLTGTKVGDIMSSPLVTVKPSDKINYAVTVMRDTGIGRVLVTDGIKPLGIVTQTDIKLRLGTSSLTVRNMFKRYLIDTFAYVVFWSGFTVLIQVFIVGISFDKFVASSALGFIVTIIVGGLFGRFLDVMRNMFKA